MSQPRFVVVGLARARCEWFGAVSAWTTSGAVPAEFIKCVSPEELRAHLAAGRRWSAALLDGGLPSVDRDLLSAVRDAGVAPIVVESPGVGRPWDDLGAAAVLPGSFDRAQLLDSLSGCAAMVADGETVPPGPEGPQEMPTALAPVGLVCGPGGTGVSTAASALAQGLSAARAVRGPVLLADLCLKAEQAMLHDARDVVSGVQELVEAHRGQHLSADEVRAHTYRIPERGYHLLLGIRRPRYWASIRPRSFEAAFMSLRRTFGAVVCDVTADFEDESAGGSADVEERNLMARTAAAQASVVFAVGQPTMKGLHSLVSLLAELDDAGVARERVIPALSHAPRAPRARAALTRTLTDLRGDAGTHPAVFLPRRSVDDAFRDGVALPPALANVLAGAWAGLLERHGQRAEAGGSEPELVSPGSLPTWTEERGGWR